MHYKFTVDSASKLSDYYQSFTKTFKVIDGKTLMSSQELFDLFHQ